MFMTTESVDSEDATNRLPKLHTDNEPSPVVDASLLAGTDLGSLNSIAVDRLALKLESVLNEGHNQVVLDLSGVTELGATALGVLVRNALILTERGGELIAVGDPLDVLQTSGLDRVIRIWNSLPPASVLMQSPDRR